MASRHVIATGILVLGMATTAQAKLFTGPMKPAEQPPASFAGAQYVDSRGCMYIRTGYGGSVKWVPRIGPDRAVMCGAQPSLARSAQQPVTTTTASTTQPTYTVTTDPVQIQKTVRKTSAFDWNAFWFGTPRTRTATPTQTAQPVVVPVTPTPVTTYQPQQTQVATGYSYQQPTTRYEIRTQPQTVHPSYYVRVTTEAQVTVQTTRTEILVPDGYKSLLNLNTTPQTRGIGTKEGQQAMDLLWTQTVPRRLIDVTTGRDVTAQYPQIRYPYTGVSTRSFIEANAGETRQRSSAKRDEAAPINMDRIRKIEDTSASATEGVVPQTTLATGQFVQVATFGVPANAARTLAQFQANGLPVQSLPVQRGGKALQIVLLGPFLDQASLGQALAAAQSAGFKDAFYKR